MTTEPRRPERPPDIPEEQWAKILAHAARHEAEGFPENDVSTLLAALAVQQTREATLVSLVRTVQRETSPLASAAFVRALDLPRIYFHMQTHLKELGYDPSITGGPAVLEIPAMPDDLERIRAGTHRDTFATAWEMGYRAAWK